MRKTGLRGIALVVLGVGLVAGCATSGTVKKVTPADASLLTGTWQGWLYPADGDGYSATLTIRPDGSYDLLAGAFSSQGNAQIKDGYVHFVSTIATGPVPGDRSGDATLMDKGSTWGLVGNGYATVGGPFDFNVSKAK